MLRGEAYMARTSAFLTGGDFMKNSKFDGGAMQRRDGLKTLGAASPMAAMSKGDLFGQFINKSAAKGGRIDVPHHHVPPGINAGAGFGGRGAAANAVAAGARAAAGRGDAAAANT